MSSRCHENLQLVKCDHHCEKISEPVLGKTGIIWARCPGCGHTIDLGEKKAVPTVRGFAPRQVFYMGVSNYFDESGRMYFRISGGECQ